MRDLIKVLKAVADKNRMRILKMLEQRNMCVCEIAAVLGINQPSASKHLVILKGVGLISDERNGPWIDYSLCEEKINRYAPELRTAVGRWLNDDACIREDRQRMKKLIREELCKR